MDRDGRLFGKISIVDVIVLLVVAVMVAAVYVKTHKPQTGSNVGTTTVVYQMELENQLGDQMFDKERSTGGSLGTITDIQVSGGTYEGKLNDGTVAMLPAEDCYNILLTIEGEALIEGNGSVMLNRIYSLGVNSNRNFNTQYANFVGTIVDLQIPGGDQ